VAGDDDRSFDNRRFHCPSPISILYAACFMALASQNCAERVADAAAPGRSLG
jgi:hypothetical protein